MYANVRTKLVLCLRRFQLVESARDCVGRGLCRDHGAVYARPSVISLAALAFDTGWVEQAPSLSEGERFADGQITLFS